MYNAIIMRKELNDDLSGSPKTIESFFIFSADLQLLHI